jgi:arylamine N-acetyltransferase
VPSLAPSLDAAAISAKLVMYRRSGWCDEHNGLITRTGDSIFVQNRFAQRRIGETGANNLVATPRHHGRR